MIANLLIKLSTFFDQRTEPLSFILVVMSICFLVARLIETKIVFHSMEDIKGKGKAVLIIGTVASIGLNIMSLCFLRVQRRSMVKNKRENLGVSKKFSDISDSNLMHTSLMDSKSASDPGIFNKITNKSLASSGDNSHGYPPLPK
jgi:hypothetical protein